MGRDALRSDAQCGGGADHGARLRQDHLVDGRDLEGRRGLVAARRRVHGLSRARELSADFTAVGGGRSFGNPNLKPEASRQIEVGSTWRESAWKVDAALFQNTISDRIITVSRGPTTNTSDYANNAAD
ncbi:MAG: TonB-dependent receptor, partial [Comamonas sp.]